ncbi:MAG: hypothetical protein AAFR11_09025 [Pseudomonadota bacterium]
MLRAAFDSLRRRFAPNDGAPGGAFRGDGNRAQTSYDRVELESDGFTDAASRPILGKSARRAAGHCATPEWARDALAFPVRDWRETVTAFGRTRSRMWTIGTALAAGLGAVVWVLFIDALHANLDPVYHPGSLGSRGWTFWAIAHCLATFAVASYFYNSDFKPGSKAKLWNAAIHEAGVIRGGVQRALDTELLDRIRDAAGNAAPAGPDQDLAGRDTPQDELTRTLDLWRIAERGFRNIVFRYDAFRQIAAFSVVTRGGEALRRDLIVLALVAAWVGFAVHRTRIDGGFVPLFDGDLETGDARFAIFIAALAVATATSLLARWEFHRRSARYARLYILALSAGYLDALPGRSRLAGDVSSAAPGRSPYGRDLVASGPPEIERIKRSVAADLVHAPTNVAEQIVGVFDSVARRKLSDFDQTDAIRDGYQALRRRVSVSSGFKGSNDTPAEPTPRWRAKPEAAETVAVSFDAAPRRFRHFDPAP